MTSTRERVYDCIEQHIQESGCGPTCREISAEIGISLSTVYGHLQRLQNAGLICMSPDMVRGVSLPREQTIRDNFGARLTAARMSCGLTREQLAQETGISYATVCSHEDGLRHPNAASLRRYCGVLNLANAG